MKKIVLLFLILMCMFSMCFAHSGRTDEYGGHYDSSTGAYHYHNEGYAIPPKEDLKVDEDTKDQDENSLVVMDTSNEIQMLKDRVNTLQSEITYKQNTIGKLNNEIVSLKDSNNNGRVFFIVLLIVAICISYNVGKFKHMND